MSRFVLTAQLQLQAPNNVAQVVRQIQSQLNGVNVNLNVQGSARAQRQLQQVTTQTQAATTAADRMGRAFAISIRRFAAFSIATRAVSLFTSTLSDAVKTAIDFERELVKISQVTGQTMAQLKGLTREISSLATNFGVGSQSLLGVTRILSQAGFKADDLTIALRTLAKTELAPTFDNITQTAEGAIAIFNQFRQGAAALEAQLGAINAVAGQFAVEAGDLIDVVRRAGGVFKSAGGELNELIALFTSVRATTRESAESIGTGLRTIFTRIQRPKTIEFLKQFGIELLDLEGRFVGPFEAIKRLSEALSGLGEGDITFIRIAEELGGFRQIGKVLPLLQQFSTAQAALNVANKAGNSLTEDAAKAQQSLAVRIVKVKEEFLALIRSVTETTTFQVMANTALSLASALIKIGEAIKPLLPLLAAVAAVKFARGISGFAAGIMGGMRSGRTYGTGGKVHHFARGGMVPGTGNRDTVPAMLQPGEFVIKKSSVNKLGAGNLAAMNENRYAAGGVVTRQRSLYGPKTPWQDFQKQYPTLTENQARKLSNGTATIASYQRKGIIPTGNREKGSQAGTVREITIGGKFGTSFLRGYGSNPIMEGRLYDVISKGNRTGVNALKTAITKSTKMPFDQAAPKGAGIKVRATNNTSTFLSPDGAQIFDDEIMNILPQAFDQAAKKFTGELSISGPPRPLTSLLSKSAINSIEGQFFEAYVRSITNNVLRDEGKTDSIFDFNSINEEQANKLFGTKRFVLPNEFKNDPNQNNINSILAKAAGQVGGIRVQKFAAGGGVGTDTVPALLTPGEFVVNRSSAQSIGYGNLNRMNKVGKYAKGGVVQKFANGGSVSGTQAGGIMGMDKVTGGLLALSTSLSYLTPVVDENSSSFQKATASVMSTFSSLVYTITGVQAALSTFGLQLNAQSMGDFLTGKSIPGSKGISKMFNQITGKMGNFGRVLRASTQAAARGGNGMAAGATAGVRSGYSGRMAEFAAKFGTKLGAATKIVTKFAGPLLSVVTGAQLAAQAFRGVYDSIYDFEGRLKTAIEGGNVEEAKRVAAEKAGANSFASVKSGGTVAAATATGLAIGSFIPVIGTAVGAFVGFTVGLITVAAGATESADRLVALAAAQAGAVKLAKTLEQTQKDGAVAMQQFNKGLISSSKLLDAFSPAFSETSAQNTRLVESVKQNIGAKSEYGSGKIARNLGAYLGGGLFGMETAATRNKRLESENVANIQAQTKSIGESFSVTREARNAAMRSALFRGEDPEKELRERGMDTGSMKREMSELRKAAIKADIAGNEKEAEELRKAAAVYEEEIRTTQLAMENLKKEVDIAKAKFAALNLGLRSVTAAADAASVRMTNAMNSFDLAAIPGVNALNTLEASLTAAGQNISQAEFDSALSEVSGIMKKFGADAKQVKAFEDLTKGVAAVQRDFPNMFDTLKDRLEGGAKDMSAENIGNEFKKIIGESLDKAGIGDAAKQRIIDSMGDVKIEGQDLAKLMAGDISVLEKYFGDAAEEVSKNVKGFMDKWISVNQELIKATQERIEAERNLVAAQREAVDLYMEGREVQAKYGGRAVSFEERRSAILAKSNIGAAQAGLGAMRTGSVAELRQRNMQIAGGFANIEGMRGRGDSAMGAEGAELQATQQDLQQAQKDQVQTIRDLIKLEEEELKIIQEKNRMEKDSLEALISGDVEKFFEGQAAAGAQAAIAAGDMRTANMFGAKAVADAFKDIQRQQEAGVQTMFGRQLAGPGGLAEQAAQASLATRGIMDPRMAQVLAGTTPEEEARKATLRELGGVLGEAGMVGAAMAEMQVQTAQMKVERAELVIANLETGGAPAEGKAMGGLIYANRGIFVPRGTDTVPAMLTPGEFVVRREAVNRGNNLQLLRAINSGGNAGGMARGGKVGYYNNGGMVQYKALGDIISNLGQSIGIDPQLITNLGNVFTKFVTGFNESIKNLQNTKLQIKMDSVNVNVNLNASSMLGEISAEARKSIMQEVIAKIQQEYSVGPNRKLKENKSNLG